MGFDCMLGFINGWGGFIDFLSIYSVDYKLPYWIWLMVVDYNLPYWIWFLFDTVLHDFLFLKFAVGSTILGVNHVIDNWLCNILYSHFMVYSKN